MKENCTSKKALGLYIHIPFCVKKCGYCDFLSFPMRKDVVEEYFDALYTEIENYRGKTSEYIVTTIFIGGGTPSSVDGKYIKELMVIIQEIFDIDYEHLESTIEINPGILSKEKLETYYQNGINRISFGLQSANNDELKMLGRIHNYEQFIDNYQLAREIGFKNISVDLISALPNQTLESWENTLRKVIELKPEHISAYSLIIEEGTPFYDLYSVNAPKAGELPGEDEDRLIYHRSKEILVEAGYSRYEISNYAKEGYESRHNLVYWSGGDYLGLGLGSSSLLNGARIKNMHDIAKYIESVDQVREISVEFDKKHQFSRINSQIHEEWIAVTKEDEMAEFMYLGLRKCRTGIDIEEFKEKFGVSIEEIYGDVLTKLIKNDLIYKLNDKLILTEYGIDVSNVILAEFLL